MYYKTIKNWYKVITACCAFLILLAAQPTEAQTNGRSAPIPSNHPFIRLTTDDGLAHNSVTAVLQDSTGFMWFGTADGLSRYDGYRFTTFKHEPGNEDSLSSNEINDLVEDDDGRLWIATKTGGVSIFDPGSETFTQFRPNGRAVLDNVTSLFKDEAGRIWLGMAGGVLSSFDPAADLYKAYQLSPDLDPRFVWAIDEDNAGMIWLGASTLFGLDPETAVITPYRQQDKAPANDQPRPPGNDDAPADGPPPGGPPPGGPTEALLEDSMGNLWVALSGNLHKFDRGSGKFTRYLPENPPDRVLRVISLHEDEDHILWVGSQVGLFLFDLHTEQFVGRFFHDTIRSDSLSDNHINDIFEDAGGIIWLATGNGISTINRQQAQFGRYQHHPLNENSLAAPSVGVIHVDGEGLVWTDTELYVNRLARVANEVVRYADSDNPFAKGAPPHLQRWLGIHDDGQGALWLGRWEGLFRLDKASGEFTIFAPEEHLANGQTRGGFHAMTAAGKYVWLATDGKLYRFDTTSEQFTLAWENGEQRGPTPIHALHVDSAGGVWFDLQGGIGRFDPTTNQFQFFALAGDITVKRVTDFHEEDGRIWFGSNEGLHRLDPQTGEWGLYRVEDGLPNSNVQAILADDEGQLWVSTFGGIARFDPQTETFTSYDRSDGLVGNVFNPGAAFKTAAGELFFGSTNGLVSFFPENIHKSDYKPPVVLTDFRLFNEPVPIGEETLLQRPIFTTDSLTFGPEDEAFSFEFAALGYAAPQNNRYRYQLEGYEEEWIDVADGRRFVNYTNLPPGDYVFRVQGTNNNGVWSQHEVALNITIQPHWYETWWTITGGLLLVAAVIVWRIQDIRQRNRFLEVQVAERTRELSQQARHLAIARDKAEAANRAKSTFLSNMSHELRSPLNAILGFSQIMARNGNWSPQNRENLNIISRSGEHLLMLINQVLDLSKIEAGHTTLNESDFDLHQLLADVENMFRLKVEEQNLQLLFEGVHDVPHFVRTDEVKLRQVLINLLNNALKFTEEGGVSVRVGRGAEEQGSRGAGEHVRLQFEVEDTGVGIAAEEMDKLFEAFAQTQSGRQSQEGTGLGLPISRRFVQLMGGNMTVKSQVGLGTVFHFEIVAQEAEAADPRITSPSRRVIALQPGQKRYRILIVDDIATNRQLLMSLLAPLGFELREASNGQEAIAICEAFAPHLIWMDMRMPVMNGYEATQAIKETTQGQATAVIALTASSFEGERHVILSAGCDDYLRKPFRESEIFEMMHKHLGVEYVYEEEAVVADHPIETTLKTADLTPIPVPLLTQLAHAIESIDPAQMDDALDGIRQQQPETAAKLSHLVGQFEYDTVLTLIQAVPDTEEYVEHNER